MRQRVIGVCGHLVSREGGREEERKGGVKKGGREGGRERERRGVRERARKGGMGGRERRKKEGEGE